MEAGSKTTEHRTMSTRAEAAALVRPEHADGTRQRQAKRLFRCFSARQSVAITALLCLTLPAPAAGLRAQDVAPPERQLQSEQRFLRGRIETLDRELAPYERDRLRAPEPDPLTGVPRSRRDPLAERREIERRTLQDREKLIEKDLRRQQFDRSIRQGR